MTALTLTLHIIYILFCITISIVLTIPLVKDLKWKIEMKKIGKKVEKEWQERKKEKVL